MKIISEIWHPNGNIPLLYPIPEFGRFIYLHVLCHPYLHICWLFFPVLLIVSQDGDVCISILHPPGDDKYGYESASERWLPIHTVETIMVSVISMLSDPNDESPANIDAAVCYLLHIIFCRY